jgi:hypothetical protein
MLYITRPNLGQPLITIASELSSGISLIISAESDMKDSDVKNSLNNNLTIRPVDQKDIKFPLEVVSVQAANVNH